MLTSAGDCRPSTSVGNAHEPAQKKRKANPHTWKHNRGKVLRNSGKEYVSRSTGALVPARKIRPPCTCPRKCYDIVGFNAIDRIFEAFWNLGSYDLQSAYIAAHVKSKPVGRRRTLSGAESTRKRTNEWSVQVDSKQIVVCKAAFLNIHDIGKTRADLVLKNMSAAGLPPVDQRGKHVPINKTADESLKLVNAHILSLPTCSSHYSRAKSKNRVYLPPGFTLRKCYALYQKECEERNVQAVSFRRYRSELDSYNIGKAPPKLDTCSYCDEMRLKIEMAKQEGDNDLEKTLGSELKHHSIRAEVAQNIMSAYTSNNEDDVCALAMDLQQTLMTPRLHTNVAYYKRKLWTYNLGIHNLKNGRPYFYVWNEGMAKRGSSDIGSCLMHFLDKFAPSNMKKLVIFSDNCGGQNKNISLSLLLLRYIHSGRLEMIKHYYLMPGHSMSACDRDFGNLATYIRGQEIYTTPHYVELMKKCRTVNPVTVVEMDTNEFVDLQPLQKSVTKTHLSKAGYKEGRMFLYSSNFKQGMKIWQSYNEDIGSPTEVQLQKGKVAAYNEENFDLTKIDLQPKYPSGVRLKQNKLDDLNHLARFIPIRYN